ncbi:MAG: hypothetical protein WD042_14890 [Phycisphaeraceae bacterium]
MRQSTRLILNTGATFGRMALTVGIGLVTTRLFLTALGQVDFGLVSTLGATGALLTVVTAALTASTQRHLAYDIGRGDRQGLSRTFSSALVVFAACGLALWAIGVALTPVVLQVLTIPPDRAGAAWWVYQMTLAALATTVVLTPFRGMFAAHQELFFSSILDVLGSILRLAVILGLFVVPWDRMASYAVLNLLAQIALSIITVMWSLWRYPGSRPRRSAVSWPDMKGLMSFAGWSLFGSLAWSLRQQGAVLLINLRFGPAVNAGYAIAAQLVAYAGNLSGAIIRAVQPAIVSLEAKGSRRHVHQLVIVTGKYIALILGLLFVPLWLETPAILHLWLGQVPEHAVVLTRVALIWVLLGAMGFGYGTALQATGDIGWFTRITLLLAATSLALAVFAVYVLNLGPWAVPGATVVLVLVQLVLQVRLIGRRIELPPSVWMRGVLWRVLMVAVPAGAAATILRLALDGPWRILAVVVAYNAIALPLIWMVGMERWEQQQFLRIAGAAWSRLGWGARA